MATLLLQLDPARPSNPDLDIRYVPPECQFLVRSEASEDRRPLEIKVCPMKAEAYAHLAYKRSLIPGSLSWGCHFFLPYGGERECEPVYEDVCCFGDWDWARGETATVSLHR
jgi:hypothetical protein